MSSAGEFKARALELFHAGYRVVPIPRDSKGPKTPNWPALADTQTEAVVEELIAKANGCGVGILAKYTPGVDIDVRAPELAQRLAGLAHSVLGHTVERVGQAPKLLLPYRAEKPFGSLSAASSGCPATSPATSRTVSRSSPTGSSGWPSTSTRIQGDPITGRRARCPPGRICLS
jgi:hypothetical protein